MKYLFKITAIVLLFVLMFSLVSCGKNTENDVPQASSVSEVAPQASGELKTAVDDGNSLSNYSKIYTYGNDEIESYLFWCDLDMTDVSIFKLNMFEDAWLTDGNHTFDAPLIKVGEVINYKQMVPEGAPAEGISYTAGGKNYTYAISYNGRDGGVSFVEIANLVVDSTAFQTEPEPTTPAPEASTEMLIEVFWVSEDLNVFAKEMTIESESKWHVWKALKLSNSFIPRDCSLLDFELLKDKDGVLVLNFSESFYQIKGSMVEYLLLQAIANTYIEAYNLNAVCYKVEGAYYESDNCKSAMEFSYTDF